MNLVTIEEVKEYLRLDSDAEDEYLDNLIINAKEVIENYTRLPLPAEIPASYKQAALIIIGYFFENRNGTKEGLPKVIYTLLLPYRKAAF